MHIHPSSPNSATSPQSEQSAAIKIQAGFRGYRVRKQLCQQTHRHSINGYHHYQHQCSASQRRLQRHYHTMDGPDGATSTTSVPEVPSGAAQLRDEVRSDSEEYSIEDRCATKIQAGVRGFLVRKKQKIASDAATKIQAGFRGFKARKETQKLKQK